MNFGIFRNLTVCLSLYLFLFCTLKGSEFSELNQTEIMPEALPTGMTSVSSENKARGVKPASSAERLQAMLEEIKRDMSRLKNGVNQLSESTPVSLDSNFSKITKENARELQTEPVETNLSATNNPDKIIREDREIQGDEISDKSKKLEEMMKSLELIQNDLKPIREAVDGFSLETTKDIEDQETFETEVVTEIPLRQIEKDKTLESKEISKVGFYLLPGFFSQYGDGMKWKTAIGEDYPLDESFGLGLSARLGHRWDKFFTELQINYGKNDIKKIDFGDLPLRSSGEINQIGFNMNLGAQMPVGDNFQLEGGVGLGILSQELEVMVSDLKIEEEDTLFAPLFFVGLNYYSNDEFFLNFRYKLTAVNKMNDFTRRNLHLLETSFGWML